MLASLPASTSLHRLAGFLTGSLEARLAFAAKDGKYIRDFISPRVSLKHSTSLLRALQHSQHLQLQEERVEVVVVCRLSGLAIFSAFLGGKCESGPWRDVHLCPMWKEVSDTDCLRQVGQC